MKKFTVIAAAMLIAGAAQAQNNATTSQLYGEVGYTALSLKDSGVDADLGVVRGIVGWNLHPNLALEVMLGTGVKDDKFQGVTLKLNRTYGVYLKPKYDFGNGFEVFARVGYADSKLKLSYQGASASTSDNDVSYGVGASYNFNNNMYGSLDYLSYYDKDGSKANGPTLSFGYRF